MTTKHTPGPWKVKQSDKAGDQQEDCLIYVKDDDIGIHIAETFQYQNETHNSANGTSIANARLIAAAPDLLAACKLFANTYGNGALNSASIYDIDVFIREAIAKAEPV